MIFDYTTTSLPSPVPLRYDTIYYVESLANEALNDTMRQLQHEGPLFRDRDMLPFQIKLQYVSQKELDGDYLRSQLGDKYDAEEVDEVVENMRECLCADKGGSLTARCVPSFTAGNVMEDDYAVCYYQDFDSISAENAFGKAKSFARYVAEKDFKRLMGKSYAEYQREKEYDRFDQYPGPSSSGFGLMMGFQVTNLPEPRRVTRAMQQGLSEIDEKLERIADIIGITPEELMSTYLNEKQRKGKLRKVCPIFIKDNNIYIKISEKENKKVSFERGYVSKVLYIFYLQQIELFGYNFSLPKLVSQVELENYKEVLLSIYWDISGSGSKSEADIMSWWDKGVNTFLPAVSAINKFFKEEFDVETLKEEYKISYLLEIKGKDSYGNSSYGIGLSCEYFDLGKFNVNNKHYLELYRKIESESFSR